MNPVWPTKSHVSDHSVLSRVEVSIIIMPYDTQITDIIHSNFILFGQHKKISIRSWPEISNWMRNSEETK